MSRFSLVLLAFSFVLLTASAWFFRYDVEHLRGFVVVKQDRWTGKTFYCDPEGCFEPRFVDLKRQTAAAVEERPRDLFAEIGFDPQSTED